MKGWHFGRPRCSGGSKVAAVCGRLQSTHSLIGQAMTGDWLCTREASLGPTSACSLRCESWTLKLASLVLKYMSITFMLGLFDAIFR